MEADWSLEIGPGLPRIEASWGGFVDLRKSPRNIEAVKEARQHPALREALQRLNGGERPVFTTKCDAWALPGCEIDPDEFAASAEKARAGFASYIDVVERDSQRFGSFEFHERRARELTSRLRVLQLRQGRVDFVVRPAFVKENSGYGMTLYAAGCGADEAVAYAAWRTVLGAAVAATIQPAAHPSHAGE